MGPDKGFFCAAYPYVPPFPLSPHSSAFEEVGEVGVLCCANGVIFRDFDCSGKAFPFVNPGIWNLVDYGYGDVISSWRCDELGGLDQ